MRICVGVLCECVISGGLNFQLKSTEKRTKRSIVAWSLILSLHRNGFVRVRVRVCAFWSLDVRL